MSDVISLFTKESDHLLTVSGKFVFNGKLTQGVCSLLSINLIVCNICQIGKLAKASMLMNHLTCIEDL